jgi:serine O-acetyltransferase
MGLHEDIFCDYETMSLSGKRPTWGRVLGLWIARFAFRVVVDYRMGHWCRQHRLGVLGAYFDRRNWKRGVDICSLARIGKGLRMPHPHGIVIGGHTRIGEYAHILQGVTFGGTTGKQRPDGDSWQVSPYIGDHVLIGAGAKLVGPVRVGHHSIIGANAVVTHDIPDHCVAVGIPARVVKGANPPAENGAAPLSSAAGQAVEKKETI